MLPSSQMTRENVTTHLLTARSVLQMDGWRMTADVVQSVSFVSLSTAVGVRNVISQILQ